MNDQTVQPLSDVNSVTPKSLNSFIGQKSVVEAVRVGLEACRRTGQPYPSSLFTGPPGLGKSQLTALIAAELGVPLRETLAQTLATPGDLQALLLQAADREVVFLDEADELAPSLQTLLYRALAERTLFIPRGRSGREGVALPLDEFTLILASNHESRLARPLAERFKMVCRFDYYQSHEIEALLSERAVALGWHFADGVLSMIARRSRGVPRVGLRLLEATHRVAVSEGAGVVEVAHAGRAFNIEGIDEMGLDRLERAYLRVLDAEGEPVRPQVLADRLGVPLRTLQSVAELYLVRMGLVRRTDAGRALSPEGVRYLYRYSLSSSRCSWTPRG